jgi:hypothetical protein
MIAVAIIGCGLYFLQYDRTNQHAHNFGHDYMIVAVPMLCTLGIGLCSALLDVARRGECGAFLVGFLAFGSLSLFAYTSLVALNYDYEHRPTGRLEAVVIYFYPNGYEFDYLGVIALHIALLCTPQILFALLGGLLNSRVGLVIIRKVPGGG